MNSTSQSDDLTLNNKNMISCIACGKHVHITAEVCPNCGASRRTSRYKSKTVAALFAFFTGGLGGHRFYLGQWWGIFYLLFFWLWIPGLIALIEFVYFLLCDSKKWDDKYNEGIPAGPNENNNGALIAILIVFGSMVAIAIIGILAAIALPAYQEYTSISKVEQTYTEMQPIKSKFETHYITNGVYPASNSDLGIQSQYRIAENDITIIPEGIRIDFHNASTVLHSKTLILTPVQEGATLTWSCQEGTLEYRYRPRACRG